MAGVGILICGLLDARIRAALIRPRTAGAAIIKGIVDVDIPGRASRSTAVAYQTPGLARTIRRRSDLNIVWRRVGCLALDVAVPSASQETAH
jgi:hypothetical protein